MANDTALTDDYVASLLARDAKESSIKYSSMGLEAFAQSKPPANKPKPNTRFLRNIIKDTDSHNAALLAKEAAESNERLKSLGQTLLSNEHREAKASRIGGGDIRRRQLGDIAAILAGSPIQKREVEPKDTEKVRRRVNTSSEDEAPRRKCTDADIRKDQERKIHREERGSSRRRRTEGVKSERPSKRVNTSSEDDFRSSRKRGDRDDSEEREIRGRHRTHRRRHRSISEDRERAISHHRRHHRRPSRSRSPRVNRDSRHRQRSPRRRHSSSRERQQKNDDPDLSHKLRGRPEEEVEATTKTAPRDEYDSDPLEEIIGPKPPPISQVRSRGRGTISHASGIESRFSSNYDPTTDVQVDFDEENDWDQALEALRDRQKWKQQGADRLRAAGFTDAEIEKWEKGGEKREEDVRWAKHGESREWDRGKVVDDDGVTAESSWGRLKDT